MTNLHSVTATRSRESDAILNLLRGQEAGICSDWLHQSADGGPPASVAATAEASGLLMAVRDALAAGADPDRFEAQGWGALRELLEAMSRSAAARGRPVAQTSAFVLAFKRPLFAGLQRRHAADPELLASALWALSTLVDQMAHATVATYQSSREDLIRRQQEELLELSTPVVKLWDDVLAVPMIGTLDSARTQVVLEALLQRIAADGAKVAIIDITGVPAVDTLVARHLLQAVAATRLLGAECIISGIRPQIAQAIVHLGIDLAGVTTKSTLADALTHALRICGWKVSR